MKQEKAVYYRWNAAERGFAMPIRVGDPAKWQTIQPDRRLEVDAMDGGQGRSSRSQPICTT